MRLFLCGGGSGKQTAAATRSFCDIIDRCKPLLYVPLAMEPEKYPGCLEWISSELGAFGITDIDMVTSAEELAGKELHDHSGIFIGGGNTFRLLYRLKASGAFGVIKRFIERDGAVFGGSAGAIIFGRSLDACSLDDADNVGTFDKNGFDVLNGVSLMCHYTNRTADKDRESTLFLTELSKRTKVIALPEEDTIFINGDKTEVIGTRPYYFFEKGLMWEFQPGEYVIP